MLSPVDRQFPIVDILACPALLENALSFLPRGFTDTADILNKGIGPTEARLIQGMLIDRPRHGCLQAHSLMPREYGVELSSVLFEPFYTESE